MFDLDQFIADCVAARAEGDAITAAKEVLDRALRRASDIADALPGTFAEFAPLYTSPELSIFKIVWSPGMSVPPHDHLMWAVNGIYGGEEDNVFYRRTTDGIVQSGAKRVGARQTALLGADVIHAVSNPSRRVPTASIHIYGGDYMRKQRSMWDAETLAEHPADGETIRRMFDDARAAALSESTEA